MPGQPEPTTARVRMYQVGFGDCLLLTFEYAHPLADNRKERHILFDFGSTHSPWEGHTMKKVADKIALHTHGKLDVLVATHRHRDHISGFGTQATAKIVAGLKPDLVVRPWTEEPDIPEEALEPPPGQPGFTAAQFQAEIETMEKLAQRVVAWLRGLSAGEETRRAYEGLLALAFDQIKNKAAVDNLALWSKPEKGEYVSFGKGNKRLEQLIPGVGFKVIGPPTLKQHPAIRSYAPDGEEEYWIAASQEVGDTLATMKRSSAPGASIPVAAMPIVARLRDRNATTLLNIVRRMDDYLNNTSVILLIEAGNKRLLFGGDAQVENWGYAKTQPAWQDLAKIDLYKVGHHGSRNASPESLVTMWPETPPGVEHAMVALMSTKLDSGHGHEENDTEVPRKPLVEALKKRAALYSTHELPKPQLWLEFKADLHSAGVFKPVAPT